MQIQMLPLMQSHVAWLLHYSPLHLPCHAYHTHTLCLQYVELLYLVYKNYWVYSLIFGLLTLSANVLVGTDRIAQHNTLVQLVNQRGIVPIVQAGWVRAIPSFKLVPGDIIVLPEGKATCDMVLLRGNCLVEESTLSGEVGDALCHGHR